jgi:hypothetical protein
MTCITRAWIETRPADDSGVRVFDAADVFRAKWIRVLHDRIQAGGPTTLTATYSGDSNDNPSYLRPDPDNGCALSRSGQPSGRRSQRRIGAISDSSRRIRMAS